MSCQLVDNDIYVVLGTWCSECVRKLSAAFSQHEGNMYSLMSEIGRYMYIVFHEMTWKYALLQFQYTVNFKYLKDLKGL